MSFRLIDSNSLAIKYPEVNDMPCIYADIDGLDGEYYDLRCPRVVKAENDKLRELVRNLYACINNRDCDCCEYVDEACEFERNMRELGVEV